MKPACCSVCGMYAIDEPAGQKGDWLTFVDHEPATAEMLSHPQGLEYFCSLHLPEAQALRHLNAEQAIAQLRAKMPAQGASCPLPAVAPQGWLQRLTKWFRP
ncbi:hypothetical protein WKI45_14540 [Delftia tsuruhatensis]